MKQLFFLCVILLLSCNKHHEAVNSKIKEVKYIKEFPRKFDLPNIEPVNIDLMGCVDFFIADTLVIFKLFNMNHFWDIYSLNDFKFKGSFCKKGNGPNEYLDMFSDEMIIKTDSALYCNLKYYPTNKMYKVNMTKTLEDGRISKNEIITLPENEQNVKSIQLNDSTFFLVSVTSNGFSRKLLQKDSIIIPDNLKAINDVRIKNDVNSLSAGRSFNIKQKKVAESMLRLNQVNLYSWQDDYNILLCVGDHLSNVTEIDNTSKWELNKYYGATFSTEKYFAALYYDLNYKDFQTGNSETSKTSIHFFDWNGNPILELSISTIVDSFSIIDDKVLYVLSTRGEFEKLYAYDIESYLLEVN
jgi:hypothetical protein